MNEQMQPVEKAKPRYETPELVALGSFEAVTQGRRNGENLDATFPSGTPNSQLTFSNPSRVDD